MRSFALILSAGLAASGCTLLGPDYERPDVTVEAVWNAALEADYVARAPEDLGRWWERFEDPALDALVERSLEGSLDLESAVAAIRRSAALRQQTFGDRFPDIDGDGSYTRVRTGSNTLPPQPEPTTDDLTSLGVGFAWEIDLWGRVTRLIEAADADLEASVEDYRDLRALLVAEVVATYIDLREGQKRLAIALANVETQTASLELTTTRFEAGAAPRLDVAQARTNLGNTEASVPSLRSSIRTAELRLGVLLGEDPSTWIGVFEDSGTLPSPPAEIEVGVPADLLRQRPDVRGAERQLAAEVARVGVALGDLFPRFTLGGSIGYESTSTGSLLERDSGFLGLGPAFEWNLLDGGRVRGSIRAQRETAEIARLSYRQAVLLAIEESERALFGLARERERVQALGRAADAAQDSSTLSRQLYLEGRSDFQNVLDSERALFTAQDALVESEAEVARAYVELLRAIGGGWQTAEPPEAEDP